MKRIYLVRHAKSSWDNVSLTDKERPLLNRGLHDCKRLSNYLSHYNICPDIIFSSSARRCIHTLELIFSNIDPENTIVNIENNLYGADLPLLLNLILYTSDAYQSLMIVNHEPVLSQLTNLLIRNSEIVINNDLLNKFCTCGMAILEHESNNWRDMNSFDLQLVDFIKPSNLEI